MYESTFERKLCEYIKSLGGKAYKWVSPGTPGVPDRIAILPGGRIIFIGCTVWRISDMEDLKARLKADGI